MGPDVLVFFCLMFHFKGDGFLMFYGKMILQCSVYQLCEFGWNWCKLYRAYLSTYIERCILFWVNCCSENCFSC
jgi:hypothetical protein